jgi:hypothetical protein
MGFDLTWEIGVLMKSYAEKIKPLETEKYDYEKERQKEALEELYAQAIELNCKQGYGLIMPIDECIDWVESGSIIDYDGHGYLLDKDGERIGGMRCDVSFLENAKENSACFVAWYNK